MNRDDEEMKIDVLQPGALASLTKSEIDVQISTAKQYPRSLHDFRRRLEERATLNAETAEKCTYSLKRKKWNPDTRQEETVEITGPSVRFAEILAQSYGNLRSAARVIDEGERFVTAQGICHDLEANIVISTEIRARITTNKGKRYGDDMIGVTSNAACSKALRNSILRVIPKALWGDIYENKVKKAALGEGTMERHRKAALAAYAELGATEEQVLAALGRKGVADITTDDVLRLRNWYREIKAGEMTVEDALAPATTVVTQDSGSPTAQRQAQSQQTRRTHSKPVEPPLLRREDVDQRPPVEPEDESQDVKPCPVCKVVGGHEPGCPDAATEAAQ